VELGESIVCSVIVVFISYTQTIDNKNTLIGFGLMTVMLCPLAARAFITAWNVN